MGRRADKGKLATERNKKDLEFCMWAFTFLRKIKENSELRKVFWEISQKTQNIRKVEKLAMNSLNENL